MRFFIRSFRCPGSFTLIELLTVMAIIAILAGLILSIAGYANKQSARARAQTEIQALSAGCESYKADNGTYPHQPLAQSGVLPTSSPMPTPPSDALDPRVTGNSLYSGASSPYAGASLELYEALTGDLSLSGTGGGPGVKNYISDLRQDALGRNNPSAAVSSSNQVQYLSDPFGNCYGYSTMNATAVASGSTSSTPVGYNPTFDLWSTGGQTNAPYNPPGKTGDPAMQWIKNWQ